ncbi:hypothetical protein O3P69_020149 [Scylla paramamosain]|uniref:Uncharacterized protein n=1 Tax=Scylla paramamosain TaxID=85552 RepID=A0AAW0TK12_SCYPA
MFGESVSGIRRSSSPAGRGRFSVEEDHPRAATGNTRAWESEWMGEDREPIKISGSVTLKILPLLLAEEQPTISVNEEGPGRQWIVLVQCFKPSEGARRENLHLKERHFDTETSFMAVSTPFHCVPVPTPFHCIPVPTPFYCIPVPTPFHCTPVPTPSHCIPVPTPSHCIPVPTSSHCIPVPTPAHCILVPTTCGGDCLAAIHSLTCCRPPLVAVVLQVRKSVSHEDCRECEPRPDAAGREAKRGKPKLPSSLSEAFESCLCGGIDKETECSTCFDPVRDNPDTATLEEIFACLDTAGIDRTIAAACTERQRSSCHSSEERDTALPVAFNSRMPACPSRTLSFNKASRKLPCLLSSWDAKPRRSFQVFKSQGRAALLDTTYQIKGGGNVFRGLEMTKWGSDGDSAPIDIISLVPRFLSPAGVSSGGGTPKWRQHWHLEYARLRVQDQSNCVIP